MDNVQLQQLEPQQQKQQEPQCILVFGCSGHGKSSFINTLCRQYICEVGSSSQSCTKEIKTTLNIKINDQIVDCIDLPGLHDSNCLYDDVKYKEQMIAELQNILIRLDIKKANIRAILIVLSLGESICQLNKCLKELKDFLKNSSQVVVDKPNIVLVLTKWQYKPDEDLQEYLEDNHIQDNFNYVKWENDIYKKGQLTKPVDQKIFNEQLGQLLSMIKQCKSYFLGIPSEVQKKIDNLGQRYLDNEDLFKKHKLEKGKTLSRTERFRSWMLGGSIGTTIGGLATLGRSGYCFFTAIEGVAVGAAFVTFGAVTLAIGGTGLIANQITKPSKEDCKSFAQEYVYFKIQNNEEVNDH